MEIVKENAKSIISNLKFNTTRLISIISLLIAGISGIIIGKNKNNKPVTILSILSTIGGMVLLFMELEDNFKPIDEDNDDITE